MVKAEIREVNQEDREWMSRFLIEHWGSTQMVYRLGVRQCDQLPAFAAFYKGKPVGLVTYNLDQTECEIVSLDSLIEGHGIGSSLLQAVEDAAKAQGCKRIWLITTNDNLHALRFYQKRQFELVTIYRHAVEKARQIKPQIPLIGNDGIPIRDEIELEKNI